MNLRITCSTTFEHFGLHQWETQNKFGRNLILKRIELKLNPYAASTQQNKNDYIHLGKSCHNIVATFT